METTTYTVKELMDKKLVPFSKHYLMRLIRRGELKKSNELSHSVNYIIALNIGNGEKRARWAVELSEINEWRKRARELSKR